MLDFLFDFYLQISAILLLGVAAIALLFLLINLIDQLFSRLLFTLGVKRDFIDFAWERLKKEKGIGKR